MGKTLYTTPPTDGEEKHPHARGEDPPPSSLPARAPETPPRTWGRQRHTKLRMHYGRNTPTHVGKTVSRHCSSAAAKKHPHARGEDSLMCFFPTRKKETPPRTWGRRKSEVKARLHRRNTPTHVGKTQKGVPCRGVPEKHPHARGEDGLSPQLLPGPVETPPRTWGRLIRQRALRPVARNTPTHVGKT